MKTSALTTLALGSLVAAQTPPNFPLSITQNLKVIFGDTSVTPGQQLPRQDVALPPNISSTVFSQTGKAVLIMMDSDVPANSTSRTTLLHWLAPDITGSTDGTNSSSLTLPPGTDGVPYLQPSPPVGDYPHRYTFMLWEQPRNFSIPANIQALATDSTLRKGFNLTLLLEQSGLTKALAANYILVANNSGAATTSYPPAGYTATSTLAGASSSITGSATTEGGVGATGASASGTAAATTSAVSMAGGSVLQSGSLVGLMAAVFGMLLL